MSVQVGVLGPLEASRGSQTIGVAGSKPRAVLTMLGLHAGDPVSAEVLVEVLWGQDPPRTAAKALQTHISSLRRALGEGSIQTRGGGWVLTGVVTDAVQYRDATHLARDALRTGKTDEALAQHELALALWRGPPELPDTSRGEAEVTRWTEAHASLVEDRADVLLAGGRGAEIIGDLEGAVSESPLRERRWAQLMLGLYQARRQADALRAYQRARSQLADELGVEPGPELRRLEAQILAQDPALDSPVAARPTTALPSWVVTFLLTDIVGSSALWEENSAGMSVALERHDALVETTVRAHGGVLLKAKLEGDATISVFPRVSAGAIAALAVRDALVSEDWPAGVAPAVRIALHTGEAVERNGDYFGPALNRAARLRGLANGGQILVSQAVAEVVRDHLPDGVELRSLGEHQLRGLSRGEHVYELGSIAGDGGQIAPSFERPALPSVLAGAGPFVGRERELEQLEANWATVLDHATRAVLIAGEPGVGKTRLSGEWARGAFEQGALVLYGRCDEDLGAPYQPFAEALRSLVPSLGPIRMRSMRGLEELSRLVPEMRDLLPGLGQPTAADADTERYLLFDAVVRVLAATSSEAPVLIVLDDLHWAAKPTLLLLRHLLRFGEGARLQLIGTYRSTDLDRTHPLAGTLADLQRDGTATRILLTGLGQDDVAAYLNANGYEDEQLGATLSTVTAGNPLFLTEVLRHVEETGGRWDPTTLPQGVREAVGRRVSRLSPSTNDALLVGAVAGSRFSLQLIEQVLDRDLVDAVDEACHAGIIIEEPGGRFRFNHAVVRQSLLAEVASVKRVRYHQHIAEAIEATSSAETDERLADLAYHYFECAWAAGAAKAVHYCRLAGEQAMTRLAYEEAAELYDRAVQAAEIEAKPGGDEERAEMILARCEAHLAAGDTVAAATAVAQLSEAGRESPRLSAWATCFEGQLAALTHPEQLDATEERVGEAAGYMAGMGDDAGEAKAHTVRAVCLARLGRVADCEAALDRALTAARRAGEDRRVNSVLGLAPLAALWGPSPVARASGRCLDVIRVLRITTGSAAVEATALRCQAVLEAMRGRFDAARGMIGTARSSLEKLGLRTGLLDLDVFAGIVELIAGDPGSAAIWLQTAHRGFGRLGIDVDTAQAAALLARASLALGRDDEAEALCAESERLGGRDLKAAIAWRAVRAELRARTGQIDEARKLAEDAVALAAGTDALIDHGDSCLALAAVERAGGNSAAARAAAERAAGLYERKGASGLAGAARATLDAPVETSVELAPDAGSAVVVPDNAAVDVFRLLYEVATAGRWDEVAELVAADVTLDDHRRGLGSSYSGRSVFIADLQRFVHRILTNDETTVATRGERLSLQSVVRRTGGSPGEEVEFHYLRLAEIDGDGKIVGMAMFDADNLPAAIEALDERYVAGEGAVHLEVSTIICRASASINAQDWDVYRRLLSDDYVMVDHTPAAWGAGGPEEMVDRARAAASLASDVSFFCASVAKIAAHGAVGLSRLTGSGLAAGPFDISTWDVAIVSAGRLALVERFPVDRLDLARRRFDELEPTGSIDYLDNDALGRARLQWDRVMAGDWDTLAGSIAEEAVIDDRRSVVGVRCEGRNDVLRYLRSVHEIGVTSSEIIPIATRGDRLVLTRSLFRGRDGETELVGITEYGSTGQFLRTSVFDPADLDAAFAELDAMYATVPGLAMPAVTAAFNRRDWDTLESLWTDDFVFVDHRTPGLGTLDKDGYLASVRALVELAPDVRMDILAIPRRTDDALAYVLGVTGTQETGGGFESEGAGVATIRAGRIARVDFFPNVEQALDHLDNLVAALPSSFPTLNQAGEVAKRLSDSVVGQDRDAYSACFGPTAVFEDRRAVVGGLMFSGIEGAQQAFRGLTAISASASELVATRGEGLVLVRRVFRGDAGVGGPFEVETMDLTEIGPDGLITGRILFDSNDPDAAFAELDARFAAGEGAPYAEEVAWSSDLLSTYNNRDWSRFQTLLTDDCVVVDHRPTGWGTLDLPGFVETLREFVRLVPQWRARIVQVLRLNHEGGLTVIRSRGLDQDGGEVEMMFLLLVIFRGRRVSRFEFFGLEDHSSAVARFVEMERTSTATVSPTGNASSIALQRVYDALARRDRDAYVSSMAPDIVREDRRAIVGSLVYGTGDMERIFDSVSAVSEIHSELIATRGDHLSLSRASYRGNAGFDGGPFETDILEVVESNGDGLVCRRIVFEPSDVDAAFSELDASFARTASAELTVALELHHAFNIRNWERFRSLTADDFKFVDRPRLEGPGDLDREGFLRWTLGIADVSPDAAFRLLAVPRVAPGGALVFGSLGGSTPDGGSFDKPGWSVVLVETGRVRGWELFGPEGFDRAMARFDELVRGSVTSSPAPFEVVPDNAAVISWRMNLEACISSEWDASLLLWSENPRVEDRRSGLRVTYTGRDAQIADGKRVFRRVKHAECTTLATRGDRFALVDQLWSGERDGSEFEISLLSIVECDGEDKLSCYINFDPDDLAAAVAELNDRYAATLPGPMATAFTLGRRFMDAYNERDWQCMRGLLTDDFVLVDERVTGWGTVDRDQFVRLVRHLPEMAPDAFQMSVIAHRVVAHGSVGRVRITGTVPDGGPFELLFEAVSVVSGEKLARLDCLPPGQVDEALRRLDDLAPTTVPDTDAVADNAAAAAFAHIYRGALAGDWTGVTAGLAPDHELLDRRTGLAVNYTGVPETVADLRRIFRAVRRIDDTTVATRGETLALVSRRWSGSRLDAEFEIVFLSVVEIDAEKRCRRIILFDLDDLARAVAELDDRYAATLPPDHAAAFTLWRSYVDAQNRKDIDTVLGLVTDDFRLIDESALGLGDLDRNRWTQLEQQTHEMVPDAYWLNAAVYRYSALGGVGSVRISGTMPDGGPFELWYWGFTVVRDGKFARMELFPNAAQALQRFDRMLAKGAPE